MLLSAIAVSSERPDVPLPPATNAIDFYELFAHPLAGWLFVWLGTRVAPARKMTVAITLAVLFGIAYTAMVISGLEMISMRRLYIEWSTFRGLLSAAGAIAAATAVHHREIEEERLKHRVKPGTPNTEAVKSLSRAVEQDQPDAGAADAQYKLGVSYYRGEGVAKDHAGAVRWFRKAAEQGQRNAQDNLGSCYLNGEGVLKDYVEAYRWYNLAAAQGEKDAQKHLSEIEPIMTREQIAEAQRLAREFKPRK
jgi:hypothetical protein